MNRLDPSQSDQLLNLNGKGISEIDDSHTSE